ncbi:hypothetical protein QYF61_025455 [Mycteria americana]|uniref:ribonuclease H n=1 Tax=Mycteria americana TaxID=33587 RepID=A0AAN7N5J9_MYCAM|nr:hypothetical protein QYF61_025455 [Mycteria americana]
MDRQAYADLYPQGEEKVSGSDDKATGPEATPALATGTVATPTPVTGTAATPTPVAGTVATPTPVTGTVATPTLVTGIAATPAPPTGTVATPTPATCTAAEQQNQPVLVCHPYTQEEVLEAKVSLFSEHIVTWLLRCWDNRASSLELEGREAKQLGSLSREGGIDRAIGKGPRVLSLWRQLLSGGSQQLTVLEAEVTLTGNEWQKHTIVAGPDAPCILDIDYLRRGYFKDPKGYQWAFGIAALETEEIKQVSNLPSLSEDPSVVGLLRVKAQQVPIATTTVHWWQCHTNRDSLISIHKLIRQLESQGVISKTHPPFKSPIWPVQKSNGEWRLTVDYCGLNKVTLLLSAAVPDMLELQYELESTAAKWYATTDVANAFSSNPLAVECRLQFAFTWRGVQYTWNQLPQGWKHSPTVCHGLIQTALEQVDVINKITAMSPPTSKKETQAIVGFWRMHIPNYSLIVSTLYQVTRKKNDFKWGPEQRQDFEQIKQEIVHAVALGPVQAGQDAKIALYTTAGENGPTWSLWQKAPRETRGQPLGFWSRGCRGSEAHYTPTEKEILGAYEGVRAASEVVGTEAQLLLAPRLLMLGWMFKGRVPSTHRATDATWSKWVTLITQRARIGNPSNPGILEVIMDWPEGRDFGISPEEEVTCAEDAPLYNKLPENEKQLCPVH